MKFLAYADQLGSRLLCDKARNPRLVKEVFLECRKVCFNLVAAGNMTLWDKDQENELLSAWTIHQKCKDKCVKSYLTEHLRLENADRLVLSAAVFIIFMVRTTNITALTPRAIAGTSHVRGQGIIVTKAAALRKIGFGTAGHGAVHDWNTASTAFRIGIRENGRSRHLSFFF